MSKASFERKAIGILYDFQKSRKVWGDLVSDGLTQANALVNVQLQQGYVDSAGYWPPALEQFLDLKDRFESKLQKKADALALDFEATFTKMSAQYSKMKLQTSQFEYLMEEATESFGEAYTYKDPFGTTCTFEQIWIQLEKVFCLYTQQIALNREIMDQLVARNQRQQNPAFSASSQSGGESAIGESDVLQRFGSVDGSDVGILAPMPRDKDQGMILLSAWLNQPHLKSDTLATFDEFCQVEMFEGDPNFQASMVNQNNINNHRRNSRKRSRQTRSSPYSAKAISSRSQVRVASRSSPSPSPSPSPSSCSSSASSYKDDCLHPSCIKHRFPSGRTTHANRRCYRFTNPRRFEGILLKRGFYDRETHRSSEDSSDMAANNDGGHAQRGTVHDALDDTYHPHTRANLTVVNYNNGHPNDDEPKIKDTLYLFNKNNDGQKSHWGHVPEEEMINVKKRGDSAPTSTAAAASENNNKNKRSQQVRRRLRQRLVAAAARRRRTPKSLQDQYEDEFPPCYAARSQALLDSKFRGSRLGFHHSPIIVLIKGIEFTALAVPGRQRSCLSTEVTEGLGLYVDNVCYYNEALPGGDKFVKQTIHSIPVYLGPKKCRVSSEFDVEDMEYYDLYLGADLLPVYLKEHFHYTL
ncbi:hypothetical protein BGZ47_010408 [Haplosporangium gracile]|nr:hypothetical protein BGZ47_010408 [Haplosporangium gracile]